MECKTLDPFQTGFSRDKDLQLLFDLENQSRIDRRKGRTVTIFYKR